MPASRYAALVKQSRQLCEQEQAKHPPEGNADALTLGLQVKPQWQALPTIYDIDSTHSAASTSIQKG